MLTISNKGQTEALAHYTSFEEFEEVNGGLTLSLTSFPVEGNAGHGLLEEEAIIASDGRNFRIKQLGGSRTRKQVKAISTFFDLGGHRKYETFAGTKTFNQFADWLFAGTDWTYENVDVIGSKLIPNYGNENFLKLLEVLLSTFECERRIMPENHIVFEKQIGPDNDDQYRYGHNIKSLSHSVDTTNLRTSIKGYGGAGLEVTYTSPNAAKFPHAGEAEPVSDERFTIAASLIDRIKQDLNDVPEVAIEMEALELTEKELGERVWLIYEPLGIEFQTRILAKTSRKPAAKSSAVIGNAMPKNMTDQLTERIIKIDENQKQTQSKFEQTNERISLEVEQIGGEVDEAKAAWTIEATSIRGEVSSLRTYTDDEIGKVEQTATSNFNLLAGQISAKAEATTVTNLGTRVDTVEWDMNALEGTISSKVSKTDYTGNTITSLINQSATTIDIQASKINLVGAVSVLSDISGNLGTITSGNINITQDARIGNKIYLGGNTVGVSKELIFNTGSRITGYHTGTESTMSVYADLLSINAQQIDAPKLVRVERYNNYEIELAWNGVNRVYLTVDGVRKGYLAVLND